MRVRVVIDGAEYINMDLLMIFQSNGSCFPNDGAVVELQAEIKGKQGIIEKYTHREPRCRRCGMVERACVCDDDYPEGCSCPIQHDDIELASGKCGACGGSV